MGRSNTLIFKVRESSTVTRQLAAGRSAIVFYDNTISSRLEARPVRAADLGFERFNAFFPCVLQHLF